MPRSADSRNGLHSRVLHTTTFSFTHPPAAAAAASIPPPLSPPSPSLHPGLSPFNLSLPFFSLSFRVLALFALPLSRATFQPRPSTHAGTPVHGRIGTVSRFWIRYRDPFKGFQIHRFSALSLSVCRVPVGGSIGSQILRRLTTSRRWKGEKREGYQERVRCWERERVVVFHLEEETPRDSAAVDRSHRPYKGSTEV